MRVTVQGNGAEKLSRKLNFLLGLLINEVETYGGDVVKFSGDAVTVTWDCASAVKGDYGAMLLACQVRVGGIAPGGTRTILVLGLGLGLGLGLRGTSTIAPWAAPPACPPGSPARAGGARSLSLNP